MGELGVGTPEQLKQWPLWIWPRPARTTFRPSLIGIETADPDAVMADPQTIMGTTASGLEVPLFAPMRHFQWYSGHYFRDRFGGNVNERMVWTGVDPNKVETDPQDVARKIKDVGVVAVEYYCRAFGSRPSIKTESDMLGGLGRHLGREFIPQALPPVSPNPQRWQIGQNDDSVVTHFEATYFPKVEAGEPTYTQRLDHPEDYPDVGHRWEDIARQPQLMDGKLTNVSGDIQIYGEQVPEEVFDRMWEYYSLVIRGMQRRHPVRGVLQKNHLRALCHSPGTLTITAGANPGAPDAFATVCGDITNNPYLSWLRTKLMVQRHKPGQVVYCPIIVARPDAPRGISMAITSTMGDVMAQYKLGTSLTYECPNESAEYITFAARNVGRSAWLEDIADSPQLDRYHSGWPSTTVQLCYRAFVRNTISRRIRQPVPPSAFLRMTLA